jgi:hypothetical protein
MPRQVSVPMFVQLLCRRARSFTFDCQKLIHRAKFKVARGGPPGSGGRSPCQDFPGSCWDRLRQSRSCPPPLRSRHPKLRPRYHSSAGCPGSCPTAVSAAPIITAAAGEVTTKRGTSGAPKKGKPRTTTIPERATTLERATTPETSTCNFRGMGRKRPRPTRRLPALHRQPRRRPSRRPDSRAATYRLSRRRSNEKRGIAALRGAARIA